MGPSPNYIGDGHNELQLRMQSSISLYATKNFLGCPSRNLHPPSHNHSEMGSNYSSCLCTNFQPLKISNVPYDVPSKPSTSTLNPMPHPCCTLAHQTPLLSVSLFAEPSKVLLIMLNARSLASKLSALRRFVQNHPYDIMLFSKTWLTGYTTLNQIFLSG